MHAGRERVIQRADQLSPVAPVGAILRVSAAQLLEETGVLDRVAGGVAQARRDDEEIGRVLVEELVRLCVERRRRRVPDRLVDPSSVFSTSMSAQSELKTAQFGLGRSTRTRLSWDASGVVKRSLGKGDPEGAARSKVGCTPAARASDGRARATRSASRRNRRGDGGIVDAPCSRPGAGARALARSGARRYHRAWYRSTFRSQSRLFGYAPTPARLLPEADRSNQSE